MSAFDNPNTKKTAIVLVAVLVIIVLIISFILGGFQGIFGVLRFFIILSLVIGFIGLVVYVVWYLFIKQQPRNIPYENWKSYVKSAVDNGADMMNELVLVGDKRHSGKRFMTIKGYLRILAFDGYEYDMFIGKKNPMNFFEEYKVVILAPDEHSDMIGDVYVYGISLLMKYGYFFLNQDMLNFKQIDQTIAMDTYRTLMYETLGDLKQITDRAIGLDPQYRKEQMQQKLLKIPTLQGQQQQQPPQGGAG